MTTPTTPRMTLVVCPTWQRFRQIERAYRDKPGELLWFASLDIALDWKNRCAARGVALNDLMVVTA